MTRTPLIRLTADNKPLNDKIMARLISLSVTDNKAKKADELAITLDDHDGALELPKRGVKLQCWLGYADRANANSTGMVDMGVFVVDSSEWSGTPDVINVKAKSADFKSTLKAGRSQSYHDTTLGNIASEVATRHGLELKITPSLSSIRLPHIDQTDESDIHLLTRLCHRYGAVFAIKQGKLLIFIANRNETVTGRPLTLTEVSRQTGDRFRFAIEDRQSDYGKVEASYQDKKKAKRKTTTSRVGPGKASKKLKGTYPDKDSAMSAVHAESKRIKEQQAKFSITCANGYPAISTEAPIKLNGFKKQINDLNWTVDKATHSYSKNGGLTTQLELVASLG